MRILKLILIWSVLSPALLHAAPIPWNAEVAKDNARAAASLIRQAESAIAAHSRDVEKKHLPTIERMIAGFNEQHDLHNPAVARYENCLDALESFRPYLTVSLKPSTPGHRQSMASSKKAYLDDLSKCKAASKN